MRSVAWFHKTLAGILLGSVALSLPASTGCGINPNLTEQQQEKDAAVRMAWVEKAIQVAERHGLAYRVEVNASGRPSIGETVDLYIDTGVDARIIMFGNGAAGREPSNLRAEK